MLAFKFAYIIQVTYIFLFYLSFLFFLGTKHQDLTWMLKMDFDFLIQLSYHISSWGKIQTIKNSLGQTGIRQTSWPHYAKRGGPYHGFPSITDTAIAAPSNTPYSAGGQKAKNWSPMRSDWSLTWSGQADMRAKKAKTISPLKKIWWGQPDGNSAL